jgi:IclR family acetate operon transcriptional repressor
LLFDLRTNIIVRVTAKESASATTLRKGRRKGTEGAGPRDPYFSRAVSKALEALEFLHANQGPMTLNEIAQRVQLSKTSAFRLLRTLECIGYLESNGGGQYSLAMGASSVVSTRFIACLLRAGTPRLRDLSRELQETASLAALFDNRVEVVAVVESSQAIRMSNVVGHILPPNASSLGKMITAFQSGERREKLLRSCGMWRFTAQTIIGRNELDRELDRVRAQEFAVDREETVAGGICFAVPIRGESNEVAAAVSVSLPKVRVRDESHEQAILAALKAAAAQISAELRREPARNVPAVGLPVPVKDKPVSRRSRRPRRGV